MIQLHAYQGDAFWLNPDYIVSVRPGQQQVTIVEVSKRSGSYGTENYQVLESVDKVAGLINLALNRWKY